MTDWNIPREAGPWGRPMLFPPEGGPRKAYSRPSTLAKDIDKAGEGLFQYYQTKAMIGMARNKGIERRVKSLVATGRNWETAKGDFKEIVKSAEKLGGSEDKANRGSALHEMCGGVEDGILDWDLVDEELKGPLDGYFEDIVSKGVKFLGREVFVSVNVPMQAPTGNAFTLRAAGSCDRIAEVNGKRRMVEIKTGKDDDFRMGVSAQLALYVEGMLYRDDVVKQKVEWADWFPNSDGKAEFASHDCDYEEAVMFHCPQEASSDGKWHWGIFRVPLERGRQIVRCGQWARKLRYIPEFKRVEL